MAQRVLPYNILLDPAITLTASSEDDSFPVDGLQDQQRQYFWRTKLGWTIVTGFNDRIDFNRGGVLVATITAGTYATGSAMAAAIVAALEAADATPVWACSYSSTTHQFTISTSAHNFTLLWVSGTNTTRSIGVDLGFTVDTGSALSHTGINQSYQSRHFLTIQIPAASRPDGIDVVALLEHNIDPTFPHDVRLLANATDSWASPTLNVDLTSALQGGEDTTRVYFSDPSLTFYRLVVTDTYNPDGYFELGLLWLSPYVELSKGKIESSIQNAPDDTSKVEEGLDGTLFVDFGRTRERLSIQWRLLGLPDQATLEAFFADVLIGECWILDLDSTAVSGALYGYYPTRPVKQNVTSFVANYAHEFVEAL
jgi:hypothetical protein